ncbi:MAG: hypothetical protein ACREXY_23080 [Gammaproteobacteria bacterium]
MPARKIQDETEVLRWFREGRTYDWMQREYLRKYNIETVPSMWSNFRSRRGLDRRIVRNDDLIPWFVKEEHRWKNAVLMLRAAARERAGEQLDSGTRRSFRSWLRTRRRLDEVVHYDPDTKEGFSYVARRKGVDVDLIREPEFKTTRRRNGDRN